MIFICCFPHRFIIFFAFLILMEIELVSERNRFIWNSFCRDRKCTHVSNKSLFCCTTFTLLVSLLIFLLMLLIVMMMIIIGWYFGAVCVCKRQITSIYHHEQETNLQQRQLQQRPVCVEAEKSMCDNDNDDND